MKSSTREFLREAIPSLLSLAFIIGITIFIINRDFPLVGHDYHVHVPRMLDTLLFYRNNGLAIQWYTPAFGGGIPAFPNPQNMQFSLPQLLMFAINPWWSLLASLAIYSAIGFYSFYFFLRDEMELSNHAGCLGATFILANGFYIEHAIVGHITFQQFPLLGLIIFLAFSKRLSPVSAGILLGLTGALLIFQGGFILGVIFLLTLAITSPLIYLFKPQIFNWKRLMTVFSIGFFVAILLSASKLNAVFSFMRFFPRLISDVYGKTYLQGLGGMALQLLGCFVVIPYYLLTGKDLDEIPQFFEVKTGKMNYGIWETDISISPVILLLLAAGVIYLIATARHGRIRFLKGKLIAGVFLFLGLWLTTDFTLAQGWLYQIAKPLPIISSLHVNGRFTSAFIFPLSFLGAIIFDSLFKKRRNASLAPFLLLNCLAILAIFVYLPLDRTFHRRNFKITPSLEIYTQIEQGQDFSVRDILDVADQQVLIDKVSNLYEMDEALFGYKLEYFKPNLREGSVFEISDGYYNMTNPASYVFPEENNLQPFERFRVDQQMELEKFVNRKQPDLEISASQKVSNFLNLVALIGLFFYMVIQVRLYVIRMFSKFQPAVSKTDYSSSIKNDR
jgi:hypothetical protein